MFPGALANVNENYRGYIFQIIANISGNFSKYKISAKFTTLSAIMLILGLIF